MNPKLKLFKIDTNFDGSIEAAEKVFLSGGVFIYPTDTIYGFGGDPFSAASSKISEIKGREEGKKFILLIPDTNILNSYINVLQEKYLQFLNSIWPNPISVILSLNDNYKKKLGSDSSAFRIPDHKFCKELLERIKKPLVSTSANRAGLPPINEVGRLIDSFINDVDAIFFEEKPSLPAASTLIDLTGKKPVLIREGSYKFSKIMKVFNNIFQ